MTTVFVSGHFNVIHPGHLRILRFAKQCGTHLLVAVESDKLAGNAAFVPEHQRLEGVACNSYVDEAFLIEEPVVEVIKKLRPDVVVKGREHQLGPNPEEAALKIYGGRLLFSSGESVFSSLDLIRREFFAVTSGANTLPLDYMARHKITKDSLRQTCEAFQNLRVTVIGDLIIDEYITCQSLGMSQEDPTIVVTPVDTVRFVGGAGVVAANAAGLGAKVNFISVSGIDTFRAFAIETLSELRVQSHILEDSSRPTTLKQRYRSKGKTLLRVSHLQQGAISMQLQEEALTSVKSLLTETDLLIFSDFNYGALPQPLVNKVIEIAKAFGIFIAADSQSSSQLGDVSRFRGIDLITPTEHEARVCTRNHDDGLVVLAEKLRLQADAKQVFVKMGEEGLLIHSRAGPEGDIEGGQILTDQVPALNSHPKDVAGAGDSLLVGSAMAMACKASVWESALLGSLAASIQVGRVGNSPVRIEQLLNEI